MIKVVVYHTKHPSINGGYTEFHGDDITWQVLADGCLEIGAWKTHTEHGGVVFAPGVWEYLCASEPNETI